MHSTTALTPDHLDASAHDRNLTLDQLRLALRNLRSNFWVMPIAGAIICVMFHDWISMPRLLAWEALVAFAGVPLAIIAYRFGDESRIGPSVKVQMLLSAIVFLVFTLCWESMGVLLWVPGNDLNHMIVILILACYIAGNSAVVSASLPLLIISCATCGAGLILSPLQTGGMLYNGISALCLLYVSYLGFMCRSIHMMAHNMLLLRYEKNDLIEKLASSKAESDRAREEAEGANRAKSQFLANMSHELRTPLNAILGFSEMMTSRILAIKSDKHYEYAGLIHDSGYHLLALINDILDLAKIEAGSWTLREVDLDLSAVILDASTMIRPRADAAGCNIECAVEPDLPLVLCDERALKQVLLNLLSNAVKFTPRGGTVTAFARRENDGDICFGVADTGVGIAPEDQERVFQNFGQGRHDIVTEEKGTGLGLPIVKGLIEAHGGRVALESLVGKGTTISVYLPSERIRNRSKMQLKA